MADPTPVKYYEDFLAKKEGKSKWTEYWVIIRGTWMLFYTDKDIQNRDKLRGSIELSPGTKCTTAKRRTYSFPFYIQSAKGSHLFKCESNLKRHQWIYVIGLSVKHSPPVSPPSFIPLASSVVIDKDGEFLSSWEHPESKTTAIISDENENEEDEEDSFSLPPGVIFVTTLPDELSQHAGDAIDAHTRDDTSEDNKKDHNIPVPVNAVLSTSITGATSIMDGNRGRSTTVIGCQVNRLCPPKLMISKPIPKSADSIGRTSPSLSLVQPAHPRQFSPHMEPIGDRPSTSPFPSTSRIQVPRYAPHSMASNLKFSRHMTSSAPNVNVISVRDSL